ncbi:MAG: porin family protein [bacterium]|nr:porin family protein [bacterium]
MKKTNTVVFLLLLSTMAVNAQENLMDKRDRFQVGVKVGGSYSNVYDTQGDEFKADAKFGVTGGAFVRIPLGTYIGAQIEGMVTQKGFKATGKILGSSYEFKRTTTFLEIPLLVALKPSEFITIVGGPQYSYLLKQRDEFTSSTLSFAQEQEFKNDNVRKNILGFIVGVDINLKNLVLGGRMGWDFQNNQGDGTSTTPRYKNVCTQITIGYRL